MPGENKAEPSDQGPWPGEYMDGGDGHGHRHRHRHRHRYGWRGGRSSAGPGDFCICVGCGEKIPHPRGVPCNSLNCPKCGSRAVRE